MTLDLCEKIPMELFELKILERFHKSFQTMLGNAAEWIFYRRLLKKKIIKESAASVEIIFP